MPHMFPNETEQEILALKDELLREVRNKLVSVNKNTKDSKTIVRYITYSLNKISIILSHQVLLRSNSQVLIKDEDIQAVTFQMEDILTYQINLFPYKAPVLMRNELIDNFEIFENVNTLSLYNLQLKQLYLIEMYRKYFKFSSRWEIPIANLIYKLATVTRNYCNVKAMLSKDISNRSDATLIEGVVKCAFHIHELAIDETLKAWNILKDIANGNRCLNFWRSSLEIYSLFSGVEEVSAYRQKIERVEKRINQETNNK